MLSFVDWGDGHFVYKDGRYIGKDDQVDPWNLLVEAGVAEWYDGRDADNPLTEEELDSIGYSAPETLEVLDQMLES